MLLFVYFPVCAWGSGDEKKVITIDKSNQVLYLLKKLSKNESKGTFDRTSKSCLLELFPAVCSHLTARQILNIAPHRAGQMSSHGATPFQKAQLTVITLAKESAALRHESVGKYFYASLKRRPLTAWERVWLLGKEKLAMSRACFGPLCIFTVSPLFPSLPFFRF